jgi:type VI secretion system protein ImpB
MDGKVGAEEVVKKLLADPALLSALAAAPNPETEKKAESGS